VSLLLDTNVVSELRKGARANARLRAWFQDVRAEEVHLSVLVIGELRRGVELVRRKDPRQAAALDRWLARIVGDHTARILPVDGRVAEEWGRLTAVRAGSVIDTLMASTALVHGLILVTRNVRHVAWTGVRCLDPFAASPS
jgi:predicted nucleic acid-binding protein